MDRAIRDGLWLGSSPEFTFGHSHRTRKKGPTDAQSLQRGLISTFHAHGSGVALD